MRGLLFLILGAGSAALAGEPMTAAECRAANQHMFEVMVANPKLTKTERAFLRKMAKPELNEDKSCDGPISEEKSLHLRCMAGASSVDDINACMKLHQERQIPASVHNNLLGLRLFENDRLKKKEPVLAFAPTPADIPGTQSVALTSLPEGPGRVMLEKLRVPEVQCRYSVITESVTGRAIIGGFLVLAECDLDGDKVAATYQIGATGDIMRNTPVGIR